ncbi:tetratricopeptide repeat protein [Cognatiluteimonas profundi]|uniref:tetratricopeptide repeat protein n=1 Tax=Cognatiluteimonas profundi TaxID=2594501 RepID=UPI00131B2306|nr:tetratricopeptide repeat protein [Lysobacter profundi]
MESTDFPADIRAALDRGDHVQALAAATAAVAARPDSAQAHRLLAAAQRASGDPAQALASIDRAIALAPDDAEAHFERAGLLLGDSQLDAAQAALARSIGLDPNLFGAYVLQAQLALGRGDLGEAARLRRLAARIAPDHPQLAAIEGTLALREGDAARAQAILATALQRHPDDAQIGYALGFVYMAQGHLAFAEQVFRNVLARHPDAANLRALIADLVRQQGRPGEAVQEIAPLLADPARATPGLRRIAGELELAAGQPTRALPWLRDALAAQPTDRRTLAGLMETLRQLGDRELARSTLDAAVAMAPDVADLWQARLAVEPVGSEPAQAVVTRWLAATPDALPALEARMALHDGAGERDAAEAIARRIVAIEPGRSSGEMRLLNGLIERDPAAAIARVEQLLSKATAPESQQLLAGWLGLAQDRAGQAAAAVATFSQLRAGEASQRLPLWQPGPSPESWPEPGTVAAGTPAVALLWGAPGSAVERVAAVLGAGLPGFRADRFGQSPPRDPLQQFDTIAALQAGRLAPADVAAQWRAGLPARGIGNDQVVDWLPFWDNQLLLALRPHLPEALLLIAIRDPRDMLLDWLAFGAVPPLAMDTVQAAATWLADVLGQVATLHEQNLHPHRLLRLDAAVDDAAALASAVTAAIDAPLQPATAMASKRFPAGHWRAYADVLGDAFAVLTPAARRLGYE